MKIGELAQAAGTRAETIRYYEQQGLLPAPARTEGNYRVYGRTHAERLAFIRHCRCLDMTLDEIRTLLHYRDAPAEDCGEVDALLDRHIVHVVSRIRGLRALEKELRSLRRQCGASRPAGDCGILDGLQKAADAHDHGQPGQREPGHGIHRDIMGAHPLGVHR